LLSDGVDLRGSVVQLYLAFQLQVNHRRVRDRQLVRVESLVLRCVDSPHDKL
jgi:hypothetical protein